MSTLLFLEVLHVHLHLDAPFPFFTFGLLYVQLLQMLNCCMSTFSHADLLHERPLQMLTRCMSTLLFSGGASCAPPLICPPLLYLSRYPSGTTPTHRKSRNYERVKPHGQHLQANMPPHPDPQACDSSQVTRIERVYIRSGLHRRVTTLWTSVPSIKGLGQQLGLGLGLGLGLD